MIKVVLVLMAIYLLIMVLMAVFQEKLIFHPRKLAAGHAFRFPSEMAFRQHQPAFDIQPVTFQESPDVLLHGLHFQLPDPQGVVLYFHGNAGSLQEWGEVAFLFLAKNYEVLMVDYRGYGKSRGKLSHQALLDDGDRFYQHLQTLYPETQIHLYGRSLGTGIAAHLASIHQPAQLVLESPYYSLRSVSAEIYPWLPVNWLHRYPLLTHEYLPNVNCPITLFHGELDQLIPCAHSKRLQSLLPEGVIQYHEIPGHGHNDISMSPRYHQLLAQTF